MEQRPSIMNVSNMLSATERAKQRVSDMLQLADDLKNDPRKEERLARCECPACFYFSRIGGAAMTRRLCMSCGKIELYGSTNTDALCPDCAKEHSLCKHCGGDLDMRTRRRNWPKPKTAENSSNLSGD